MFAEERRRAEKDAKAARSRAGMPAAAAATRDGDGGDGGSGDAGSSEIGFFEMPSAVVEDALVDVLHLLSVEPHMAPDCLPTDSTASRALRKSVSNAAQLRQLIVEDAKWHEQVSQPVEELLGSVEAIVHRAFAPDNAPALLLRGANAELWNVGGIEGVVREGKLSDPRLAIEQLHDELVRGRVSSTTTECIRDCKHKAMNLKHWLFMPREAAPMTEAASGRKQFIKLLHIKAEQEAFPILARLAQVPEYVRETNWVGAERGAMLQLVLSRQDTCYHRDNNGMDTWMKLLAGQVFVACWSQADGSEFGLTDEVRDAEMDWSKLKQMDSARIYLMRAGDVLLIPSGSYHYVYTVKTKLVIAGDYVCALGWRRRDASVRRDVELGIEPEVGKLPSIFLSGLTKVERERIQRERQSEASLSAGRRRELQALPRWAEEINEEVALRQDVHVVLSEARELLRAKIDA